MIGVKQAGNVWHAGNKRHLTEVSGTKTEIFKIGINRVLFQGTVFKSRPFHGRFFIALKREKSCVGEGAFKMGKLFSLIGLKNDVAVSR